MIQMETSPEKLGFRGTLRIEVFSAQKVRRFFLD